MGTINNLTELTAPEPDDLLLVRDISEVLNKDKRMTLANLGSVAQTFTTRQVFRAGLLLTDADVAHGMTAVVPTTDTVGLITAFDATGGGLYLLGATDTASNFPLVLTGIHGDADPSDTIAAVLLQGYKKNGTGVQALGASETVVSIYNGSGSIVRVLGNGNVGIGVTPAAKLDVAGHIRSTAYAAPSSGAGLEFAYDIPTARGYFFAYDRSASAFKPMDIEASEIRLNPSSGGRVGIGVSVPQGKLHIHDGTSGQLFTSKSSIVGSAQTIIPDGVGDVGVALTLTGVTYNSAGQIARFTSTVLVVGGTYDIDIAGGGANVLRFAVSGTGAFTVIRQAGSATWHCAIHCIWI